ncbi:MAG: hypothetical protein ABR529_02625 [Actinomycetota bacterium]
MGALAAPLRRAVGFWVRSAAWAAVIVLILGVPTVPIDSNVAHLVG